MALDSDTPNADAQLEVKFYTFEGEGMFKGVPHVRIIAPGDDKNINDRVASEYDKMRFQRQWLHFQADSNKELVIGTPISVWRKERPEELSDGQLQELMILKFMSVEQVAMASDTQVQRVGMGGAGLRERARSYLNAKNAQAAGTELKNAQAEIDQLKLLVAQLAERQAVQPAAPPPKPSRLSPAEKLRMKRAELRKNKDKATVDVQHDNAPAGAASV